MVVWAIFLLLGQYLRKSWKKHILKFFPWSFLIFRYWKMAKSLFKEILRIWLNLLWVFLDPIKKTVLLWNQCFTRPSCARLRLLPSEIQSSDFFLNSHCEPTFKRCACKPGTIAADQGKLCKSADQRVIPPTVLVSKSRFSWFSLFFLILMNLFDCALMLKVKKSNNFEKPRFQKVSP